MMPIGLNHQQYSEYLIMDRTILLLALSPHLYVHVQVHPICESFFTWQFYIQPYSFLFLVRYILLLYIIFLNWIHSSPICVCFLLDHYSRAMPFMKFSFVIPMPHSFSYILIIQSNLIQFIHNCWDILGLFFPG